MQYISFIAKNLFLYKIINMLTICIVRHVLLFNVKGYIAYE